MAPPGWCPRTCPARPGTLQFLPPLSGLLSLLSSAPGKELPSAQRASDQPGLHHTLHAASSQGRLCSWTVEKDRPPGLETQEREHFPECQWTGPYPEPGLDQGSTLCGRGARKPVGPSPWCGFRGKGSFFQRGGKRCQAGGSLGFPKGAISLGLEVLLPSPPQLALEVDGRPTASPEKLGGLGQSRTPLTRLSCCTWGRQSQGGSAL